MGNTNSVSKVTLIMPPREGQRVVFEGELRRVFTVPTGKPCSCKVELKLGKNGASPAGLYASKRTLRAELPRRVSCWFGSQRGIAGYDPESFGSLASKGNVLRIVAFNVSVATLGFKESQTTVVQ